MAYILHQKLKEHLALIRRLHMSVEFNETQKEHLEDLNFSVDEILALQLLDNKKLRETLKEQWHKLTITIVKAIIRKESSSQKLVEAAKAYQSLELDPLIYPKLLITPLENEIELPTGLISLEVEQELDNKFEAIETRYLSLETKEERDELIEKNKSLILLMRWLIQNRHTVHQARMRHFFKERTLGQILYENYNRLVVELFAKENLDDVYYGEAISLGLYPRILSREKLMWPFKWLCLVLNGSITLITDVLIFAKNEILMHILSSARSLSKPKNRTVLNTSVVVAKMFAAILALVLLMNAIPSFYLMAMFSLPAFMTLVKALANPINTMINPLSNRLGNQMQLLGVVGLTVLLTSGIALLTSVYLSMSVINLIALTANLLALASFINTLLIVKKAYELSPILGAYIGLTVIFSVLLVPTEVSQIETLSAAAAVLISNLGMFMLTKWVVDELSFVKEDLYQKLMSFSFIGEKSKEEDLEIIAHCNVNKNYSNKIFGTHKNIKFEQLQYKPFSFFTRPKKAQAIEDRQFLSPSLGKR